MPPLEVLVFDAHGRDRQVPWWWPRPPLRHQRNSTSSTRSRTTDRCSPHEGSGSYAHATPRSGSTRELLKRERTDEPLTATQVPHRSGCGCCGPAGAGRRRRELAWERADGRAAPNKRDAKTTGHPYNFDDYYVGSRHKWILKT